MTLKALFVLVSVVSLQAVAKTPAKSVTVVCNGVNDDSRYAFNLKFDRQTSQYTGTLVDKQAPTAKQILVSRDLVFSNSSYWDDLRIFELVGLKVDYAQSKELGKTVMVQDHSIKFSAMGIRKSVTLNGVTVELEQICAKNQEFLDNILNYLENQANQTHGD
jgi:hypothetical protein